MAKIVKTKQQLLREIKELRAQMAFSYHFASMEVKKSSGNHLLGSAVIIEITGLGGKQILQPIAINDGLSPETVAALHADILRSYERATELKPK